MSLTADYLKKAILGESNAIKKYQKFAEIAKKENFHNIGYLFDALVHAEQIHLKNHKQALIEPDFEVEVDIPHFKDTKSNILAAIEGETYEYKSMYPEFIKACKSEQKTTYGKVGILSMKWAKDVEMSHVEALDIALQAINDNKDLEIDQIWVCKVCGNLIFGDKPKKSCPVCKHDSYFYDPILKEEKV